MEKNKRRRVVPRNDALTLGGQIKWGTSSATIIGFEGRTRVTVELHGGLKVASVSTDGLQPYSRLVSDRRD